MVHREIPCTAALPPQCKSFVTGQVNPRRLRIEIEAQAPPPREGQRSVTRLCLPRVHVTDAQGNLRTTHAGYAERSVGVSRWLLAVARTAHGQSLCRPTP